MKAQVIPFSPPPPPPPPRTSAPVKDWTEHFVEANRSRKRWRQWSAKKKKQDKQKARQVEAKKKAISPPIKPETEPKRPFKPSAYMVRNELLPSIGYASYPKYLESPLWQRIRAQIITRDHGKCKACNRQADCVHHLDYDLDTLRGVNLTGLIAVCHECHDQAEFTKGAKNGLQQANAILRAIAHGRKLGLAERGAGGKCDSGG